MSRIFKKSIHLITAVICSITLFLAGAFIVPKPINASAGIQPDPSFEVISFSNFEIADGVYDSTTAPSNAPVTATSKDTFDKKYFSADVKFSSSGAKILLADDGKGNGLTVNASNAAILTVKFNGTSNAILRTQLPTDTITSFINTEFNLGISFEVIAADADSVKNDLKLGVWINGVLYKDNFFTIKNKIVNFDNNKTVTITCNTSASVEVKSDSRAKVLPNKNLDWISIEHFYVKDGVYGTNNQKPSATGTRFVGVNNSYFTTNITFSATEGAAFRYAGMKSAPGLSGLSFTLKGGKLVLTDAAGVLPYEYTFEAEKAGLTKFADTPFKLGISFEYIDADEDTQADDLKLGIWFNDVLYENNFIYFGDAVTAFGNSMGVFSNVKNSTITLGAIEDLKVTLPDKDIDKITLDYFGMQDGVYTYAGNGLAVRTQAMDGVIGKYFSTDMKVSVKSGFADIIYGFIETDGWQGTRIRAVSNTEIQLLTQNQALIASFKAENTSLKNFSDKNFRFGISIEALDNDNDGEKDDVKIGVYFNEDLYNDTFVYVNDYTPWLGNGFSFYANSDGASIELGTIKDLIPELILESPNDELKLITLTDFGVQDGVYTFANHGFSFMGANMKPLDNTYVVMEAKFDNPEQKQMYFRYAGEGWGGISIVVHADNIEVFEASGYTDPSGKWEYYSLPASKSKIDSFYGEKYKLGFSTEILDIDGDGKKNDVRLGIFVNDQLCANKYCDFIGYAPNLKTGLGLYIESDKATAEINGLVIPVDFALFGFTEEWAKELAIYAENNGSSNSGSVGGSNNQSPATGEKSGILKSVLVSCIALGGILKDENKKYTKKSA